MYPTSKKSFHLDEKFTNNLIYTFLFLGFIIRLFHLVYNRSLWMDEIYLSSSLVQFNLKELITNPLLYQQKAPIGFLILVKFILNIFGNVEYTLRIIPFISGICSIFVFVPVAKFFLKNFSSALAIGIMCLAPALIYHSVEIKQYSIELLATTVALYLYIKFKNRSDIKAVFCWASIGGLILWFSYSTIFILAGIAIGVSITNFSNRKWKLLCTNGAVFLIWFSSFLINFVLFTHKHAESEWIVYWFRTYDNFMPFPPKSLSDLRWFPYNLYKMMDYPLGLVWKFERLNNVILNALLKTPYITLFMLIIGIYDSFKKKLTQFLILIFPVILTLIASGLELYPLTERFWVFIAPIFIIFIGYGFNIISTNFKSSSIKLVILFFTLAPTCLQAAASIVYPQNFYFTKKSYQRESLLYINKNYLRGDAVYIYWNNLPGSKLYKKLYKFNFNAIEGTDMRKKSNNYSSYFKNLQYDFDKFSDNNRVWVIYNKQFNSDIGDKIDDPQWYYAKNSSPIRHLTAEFHKKFNIVNKYETKDIIVFLFVRK